MGWLGACMEEDNLKTKIFLLISIIFNCPYLLCEHLFGYSRVGHML